MMIHPKADVQTETIGEGTRVWQYTVVLPGAVIGRNCNLNAYCLVEGGALLGDRVTLKCGVYVWDGVQIEDDVFVGPNVSFTNDPAPRSQKRPVSWAQTRVLRGASLGANATLLPGITIGEYAFVGAGSVVTRDVPAHGLWFGNPAGPHGYVCRCARRLSPDLACHACGSTFRKTRDGIVVANE